MSKHLSHPVFCSPFFQWIAVRLKVEQQLLLMKLPFCSCLMLLKWQPANLKVIVPSPLLLSSHQMQVLSLEVSDFLRLKGQLNYEAKTINNWVSNLFSPGEHFSANSGDVCCKSAAVQLWFFELWKHDTEQKGASLTHQMGMHQKAYNKTALTNVWV